MEILVATVGVALVCLLAGFWLGSRSLRGQLTDLQSELQRLRQQAAQDSALSAKLAAAETLAEQRLQALERRDSELRALQQTLESNFALEKIQAQEITRLTSELGNEKNKTTENLALLEAAKTTLANHFQALAGEVLDARVKTFSEGSQTQLGVLLQPLSQQIKDFREKVESSQKDSNTGVTELKTLIGSLTSLNQQLATEAQNLTLALRGSAKAQGDWGEFILRDLLEKAGLREGDQYSFQQGFSGVNEDGERARSARTDVVLNLPGGRHLVVDSKVSLVAYTDYANATEEGPRTAALKQHLASVHRHLDGLAERKYHKLTGIDSPDFVVLFIPIEPAYLLAMQADKELWHKAYQRNVLLVGPTTLLFVIRIVDNLWQQEQQARSVREIVDRGTRLYDKFVGFVEDMQAVGDRLGKAQSSYQSAMGKLTEGSGNLISQVDKLKQLGLRSNKQIPQKLRDAAGVGAETESGIDTDNEAGSLFLAAESEES